MRAKAGFLILLVLVLLIGTVTADMADAASTISASKEWPVANNADASVITVVARNTSSGSIPAVHGVPATVAFTVDDGAYGSFSAPTVTTDSSGIATSSFNTKTKSGTAVITATITSDDGGIPHTTLLTINQKIDHDLAQFAIFNNQVRLPVATVTTFDIVLTDRWGNLIDNKNPAETHTMDLNMAGGQGRGLWDGSVYVEEISLDTDSNGKASVTCRLAEVATSNFIFLAPIGNMAAPQKTWIDGYALDEPYFMLQIHPSPDDINADGVQAFEISYILYDMYMNPVNHTPVHLSATDGTSFDDYTNVDGVLYSTFGPKDTAGVYTIIATAGANASINCTSTGTTGFCSQNLTFHNTEPVDLLVSGDPQGMPSLDVNPASRGAVLARVVDIKGNPVIGETVTFTMGTPWYPGGPYNETSAPFISPASALTGVGGVATGIFTPGAFATFATPDAFNETATGQVTVTATWTNKAGTLTKTQDVTFLWKNYPYLSISVPDDVCNDVQVGDEINISVNLFGDGAALRPKPIDVVLVNDRSGSMLEDNPDKMVSLMDAAILFNSKMDDFKDRVGLVSYGDPSANSGWADLTGSTAYPYGSRMLAYVDSTWTGDAAYIVLHYPASPHFYGTAQYAFVDLPLTVNPITNAATVNAAINGMVPSGGTPMREGLYRGVKEIKDNKRSFAVSAVILLTDGQWNTGGDPLGGAGVTWLPDVGTGSVIAYAAANNISIYTIGLGSSVNTAALTAYANQTGGKYYPAPSPSDLAGIYAQIAGDLQQVAGGNTQVYLDYGNVTVNNLPANIHDYMDYVTDVSMPAQEGDSTFVKKTNMTKSGVTSLVYQYSQDDSPNWTAGSMNFNVGEIRLNESWTTTFRVNLTKSGQIELFGPANPSKICFTDAATGATNCQFIDAWRCAVQQTKVNIPFGNNKVEITNLSATSYGDILTIQWDTTYTGNYSVTEKVTYMNTAITNPPQHHMQIGGPLFIPSKVSAMTRVITTDTKSWPAGPYTIRVTGVASDAMNPAAAEYPWTKVGPASPKYIKLE